MITKSHKEKPYVDVAKDSGCEEVSEGPLGIEVSDPSLGMSMTYCKLWYKNSNAFGIRQKILGKKQIFSIGGGEGKISKVRLAAIADRVIAMMEKDGVTEEAGKEWAKAQLRRPSALSRRID